MGKVVYTAEAEVQGGRAADHGRTTDGQLEVTLRLPKEMSGDGGGTNPRLVAAAHEVCPYSNATRGNIEVALTANGRPVG
jgi:organic hydroperoxide reductase OsmC/OhrA